MEKIDNIQNRKPLKRHIWAKEAGFKWMDQLEKQNAFKDTIKRLEKQKNIGIIISMIHITKI